jgi:homoserine kinase type II
MVKLTPLTKNDFKEILLNYSIGQYISSKHLTKALENTVYYLKTTKGEFILKVFEQIKIETIVFQTKVQKYLEKTNNPVPKIILSKEHKDILYFGKKPIQIQKFAKGKRVRLDNNLIKDYGKVIGKISFDLSKLDLDGVFPWGKDFEFKKMKIYPGKQINLKNEHNKYLSQLKKLDRKKLSRSIVHGDLNLDNTLVYKNKINAIIDFGDTHNGFLVTDPTIFICDEIISKNKFNYKKIHIFIQAFEKKVKLNNEDKKAIYYFSKLRCIYSMNWCNQMLLKHKKGNRIDSLFLEYYSKYNLFSKEPIEDFIKKISVTRHLN